MHGLKHLLDNNRTWARRIQRRTPGFFKTLARQQTPDYLWIGCSDSRVPANEIIGLLPGEIFVHRNVANLVVPGDANGLSVIHYAVDVLRVKHIIVCGHYGCGGVQAALQGSGAGLIARWLKPIKDLGRCHQNDLEKLPDLHSRIDRVCELNVVQQVRHVSQTEVVRRAWRRGQPLSVHGWIYGLSNGLIQPLGVCVTSGPPADDFWRRAAARICFRREA